MAIRKIGVLGCGLMGSGIAEVAAKAGFDTVVREVSEGLLEKGMGKIRGSLGKAVEKGKMTAEERAAVLVPNANCRAVNAHVVPTNASLRLVICINKSKLFP